MEDSKRLNIADSVDYKSVRSHVGELPCAGGIFEGRLCSGQSRLPALGNSGRVTEELLYKDADKGTFNSRMLLNSSNFKNGRLQVYKSVKRNGKEVNLSRRIEKLQSSFEAVNLENRRLRELSTEIMRSKDSNNGGEVHSFYQNVVIPEVEKNTVVMKGTIRNLNKRIFELEITNAKLKKENKRLATRVSYLKECLAKKLDDSSLITLDYGDITKTLNTKRSLTRLSEASQNLNDTTSIAETTSALRGMKENVHLELIWGALKKLSKTTSLTGLISSLYQELSILIKGCNIGVFIVDPTAKKLYRREKGKLQPMSFGKYIIDLAVGDYANHVAKPAFNSLGDVNVILRTEKSITIPISSLQAKNSALLSVQLDNKLGSLEGKGEREQWIRNEMIMGLLCSHASVILHNLLHSFQLTLGQSLQNNLMNFCARICGERTQQNLSLIVEQDLPKCLDFESANVLYYEKKSLLALSCGRNEQGELIINDFVPVPLLGLTGKCILEQKTIRSRYGKNDPLFCTQSDNALKLKAVNNIIVTPLFVNENSGRIVSGDKVDDGLVGVLQLVNSKEEDIEKVNQVIPHNTVEPHSLPVQHTRQVHQQHERVH